jgi:hypothetical protein
MDFLLPLRFMLLALLTEFFFLSVPLREGAAPWFRVEEREDERWCISPSMMDEPRVRASKSSSNLPRRERSFCAPAGEFAKSLTEEPPYPRLMWAGSSMSGTGSYEAEGVTGRWVAMVGADQARCLVIDSGCCDGKVEPGEYM